MTQKQKAILDEFISILPENEKNMYSKIIYYFVELGYIPQKNRSFISFKHKINGKIIAKIKQDEIKINFFACRDISEKYIDALRREIDTNNYCMPIPSPDNPLMPAGFIMKKCTLSCNVCTGGKMRYYYQFSDGKVVYRCGAYPVLIPDIKENDFEELKRLILQQHSYFLSVE